MKLSDLNVGESARILTVGGEHTTRRHFLDMGLTPGTVATLIKTAPLGDPMEVYIRGYELTLRKEDAAMIEAEPASQEIQRTKKYADRQSKK